MTAASRKADMFGPICDLAFYKNGQLAVLFGGSSEGSEAKLLLLPTEGLAMSAHDPTMLLAAPDILQAGSPSQGMHLPKQIGPHS